MEKQCRIYTIERGGFYFIFDSFEGRFFEVSHPLFVRLNGLRENSFKISPKILKHIQPYLSEPHKRPIERRHIRNLQRDQASLRLEISNICNNKCTYCHVFKISKIEIKKKLMSEKEASNFISEFLELNNHYQLGESIHINFYGGEPFLAWDQIKEIVSKFGLYYKRKRIVWTINTNGRLLKDEMMVFLKKYKIGLHIGCDGPKIINDIQRRSNRNEGTFDEIQQAFNLSSKYGIYRQIDAVISSTNISKLRMLVDTAKENKIKFIYLDILYKPNKLLNVKRMAEAYRDAKKYSDQQKIKLGGCCTTILNNIKNKQYILVQDKYDLLKSISVSTDGGIHPFLFTNTPVSKDSLSTYFNENNDTWQKHFNDIVCDLSCKCSSCFLHRFCCFTGILQYRYHTKLDEGYEDSCNFLREYILTEMIDEART